MRASSGSDESHPDPGALNELGNDLKAAGRLEEAEQAYVQACNAEPFWSVPWYNLGLIYKIRRDWAECARCNTRATELDAEDTGAWWNLGIAATASGDWRTARAAWRACGIEMPDSADPPDMNYGLVPLRLNPSDDGEVVWCDRLDPARAIIRNVPLPASGYGEGDVVLQDGEPKGQRTLHGRDVPVFDVIQLLVPSPHRTFEAYVVADSPDALEPLEAGALEAGVVVEDWSRSIRMICRECSEGLPHDRHVYVENEWEPKRRLGISARSHEDVVELLRAWAAAVPARAVWSVTECEVRRPSR